jgi:hypothetical protein
VRELEKPVMELLGKISARYRDREPQPQLGWAVSSYVSSEKRDVDSACQMGCGEHVICPIPPTSNTQRKMNQEPQRIQKKKERTTYPKSNTVIPSFNPALLTYNSIILTSASPNVSPPFSYKQAEYFILGPNIPFKTCVPTS